MVAVKEILQAKTGELLRLFRIISADYKHINPQIVNLVALSHVMTGIPYSRDTIEELRQVIKKETGRFSPYGLKSFVFASFLVLKFSNPRLSFKKLLAYDQKLREAGFKNSVYRALAACTLLLTCYEDRVERIISKGYRIFEEMKKNHPWITAGNDYQLALMLAGFADQPQKIVESVEKVYNLLAGAGFRKGEGLQFLSHILTFSFEDSKKKVERCRRLSQILKDGGFQAYPFNYGSLGIICLLGEEGEAAAYRAVEAARILFADREYRHLGKEAALLSAVCLVGSIYVENMEKSGHIIQTSASITVETLANAHTVTVLAATSSVVTACLANLV